MGQIDMTARPVSRSGIVDVLVAAIAPGVPTLRRRPLHGAVLLVVGLVGPILWLATTVMSHGSWIELGLDGEFLGQLILVIVIAVIARLAAVGEVVAATARHPGRRVRSGTAFAVLLAVTLPSAVGVAAVADARANLDRAFTVEDAGPLFDPAAVPPGTVPGTIAPPVATPAVTVPGETVPPVWEPVELQPAAAPTVAPPPPGPPDAGVDPALLADVSTILLLGGDAGPGRSGLRTDSMILVSIHRPSGRAALISFPRNAERILFPPGTFLAEKFPNGFNEIANAVYPLVSHHDNWRAAYETPGMKPGAVAISQAMGYSLDVRIDDYVLIDMIGFLEVVDALGGVTIDVPKAVPSPGNPPGAKRDVPDMIQAGVQHMDGTLALSYVRSRKGDSDYSRMRRQRQLLGALASQLSVADAVTGYMSITSAVGNSLHTSLSAEEFANLIALLGGETAIVESVGLAPPLVNPERPNYYEMAQIVGRVQLALVAGQPSGY